MIILYQLSLIFRMHNDTTLKYGINDHLSELGINGQLPILFNFETSVSLRSEFVLLSSILTSSIWGSIEHYTIINIVKNTNPGVKCSLLVHGFGIIIMLSFIICHSNHIFLVHKKSCVCLFLLYSSFVYLICLIVVSGYDSLQSDGRRLTKINDKTHNHLEE